MKGWVKESIQWVIALVFGCVLVFLFAMLFRWFSGATIVVKVIEPEPGIHCAKLVSGDGVAVDCWRVDK